MERLKFRLLKAEEIELRVDKVINSYNDPKKDGIVLVPYKDARCDMAILDDVVGPGNWRKEYTRDNENCTLYIYDSEKNEWIGKEDVGSIPKATAKEYEAKALASDAFKRAAVCWGIGRELYTCPFIYVSASELTRFDSKNKSCRDKFTVTSVDYDENRKITQIVFKNIYTGKEYIADERGVRKAKAEAKVPKAPATPEPKEKTEVEDDVDLENNLPFAI